MEKLILFLFLFFFSINTYGEVYQDVP